MEENRKIMMVSPEESKYLKKRKVDIKHSP
jgi:hypothetical protein